MVKMNMGFGMILFLVGIVGALLVGALEGFGAWVAPEWVPMILIIAGFLIGIFNVMDKEAPMVMIAALVLGVGAGVLSQFPAVGTILESVFQKIAFVAVPIAIYPAFKTLWEKAR